jgi:MFS family permease
MIYSTLDNKTKKDLCIIFCFAILDISFIGAFLGAFIRSNNISLFGVGIVLSLKNISRLFMDIPFGRIADIFGVKKMLLFSRISRIVSNVFITMA